MFSEQHVDFIADLFVKMKLDGSISVRATAQAQDDWVEHVNKLSKGDLIKSHP